MRKLLSVISFLIASSAAFAQGAHDFKFNEVFVHAPACCGGDSTATCSKTPSYVDEYGQSASWIEIENTSYSTHEIRNCFITINPAVLDKTMSAPEREKLMSVIPAGDPRTSIGAKQRITFFADGHTNRGTLHLNFTLPVGKPFTLYLFDGNAVDLLDSVRVETLPVGSSFARINGDEWQVQKIYIHKIAEISGKPLRYIDSIMDIYQSLKSDTFLLNNNYTYVVRDDKALNDENIQEQLDSGLLKHNIGVFLISSVDKRTKFYKRYKDTICEFERLNDVILTKYIQKEIQLSNSNCKKLIEICENDYSRILLEIDKIKRVHRYGPDKDFEDLVKDGTINIPAKDAIFDFVDAILDRNVTLAFDLLDQCYAIGEATMVMLSVLFSNTKQLLQVQAYKGSDLASSTGLSGWQIKNAKNHVGRYSIGELVYLLKLVQRVEKGIKTGTIEEAYAMQYVLVNVL